MAAKEHKDRTSYFPSPHPSPVPMNQKMVGRTPHPDPLPIGFAGAEREKRSLRPDDGLRRVVQGFKAGIRIRRNLSPSALPTRRGGNAPYVLTMPCAGWFRGSERESGFGEISPQWGRGNNLLVGLPRAAVPADGHRSNSAISNYNSYKDIAIRSVGSGNIPATNANARNLPARNGN
jgi:hypothetical protein